MIMAGMCAGELCAEDKSSALRALLTNDPKPAASGPGAGGAGGSGSGGDGGSGSGGNKNGNGNGAISGWGYGNAAAGNLKRQQSGRQGRLWHRRKRRKRRLQQQGQGLWGEDALLPQCAGTFDAVCGMPALGLCREVYKQVCNL